jgi:hypothetical protein
MQYATIAGGLGLAAMLAGCQSTNSNAEWGRVDAVSRSVLAGNSIQIDSYHHIARDCRSLGLARLRVVSPPSGGTLTSRPTTHFPSYGANNAYAACNARRVPSLGVIYTARRGFQGQDTARYELYWTDGDVWTYTLTVDVR